jgi:hypothetical protein
VFYFAWCGASEPFSETAHLREDETVFTFDLAHQEGQLPTLSIDVKNPHIGLLAPGRAQWAWLSYQDETDNIHPLFYGRLVALPSNLLGEVVTLQFVARPNDYLAQKQTIASQLMVEPYYDPIWIASDKLSDPDTILETYAMAWHVDRTTHEVSVSDIVFGEDGTEEFQPEDSFYDSVSISFAQSPQTQVVFDGTVQWTQAATGVIPMPDVSLIAWNGDQIVNDWPKSGDRLHNGWSVEWAAITNWSDQLGGNNPITIDVGGGTSTTTPSGPLTTSTFQPPVDPVDMIRPGLPDQFTKGVQPMPKENKAARNVNIHWQNEQKHHEIGDTMEYQESANYDEQGKMGTQIVPGTETRSFTIGDPLHGIAASASYAASYTRTVGDVQIAPPTAPPTPIIILTGGGTQGGGPITIPSLFGQLTLRYNLSRPHTETINFTMTSDIQPIVLLAPDEAFNQINLSLNGQDLGLPLDPGGAMPIGDPSRNCFFPTERGLLAMQYPMLVARAHLAQAARSAKINFDCTFERALDLSCRKNALLHDPRLPGGQAIGKITEYHLKADGDKGELIANVQIESTIGNGTSIVENDGNPTYADEGYVAAGYQFYSDAYVALPSGDANIVMPPTVLADNELSLPFSFNDVVAVFQIHQGTQVDLVVSGQAATADPTWLEIALVPLTGQNFSTNYDFGSSTLVLPKLIDLSAPSA